jgi:pimeloyl-ACP methyl ester carboxylesterase
MPYARNGKVKIYYEVEGEGPPLVMLHGLTGSGEGWRESGYVDALKDEYRLILMDFRGHGKSDKPRDPAQYTVENIVGDVTAVLDRLGIKTACFHGYSFGGGICYELARRIPGRIKALIIGGCGAQNPPREMLEGQSKLFESGAENIVAAYEQNGPLPPDVKAHILANDYQALAAVCKGMMTFPPVINYVPEMKMPILLYAGERDFGFQAVVETSKMLPDATLVSLPGLDHMLGGGSADLVVPHFKRFLAPVNRTKKA